MFFGDFMWSYMVLHFFFVILYGFIRFYTVYIYGFICSNLGSKSQTTS